MTLELVKGGPRKIYCFNNGRLDREEELYHGLAVGEDGHVLAQCLSSSLDWIKRDLGLAPDSKKKHDIYIRHFTKGFELEWVEDPASHEGLQIAQDRNRLLAEEAKAEETERAIADIKKMEKPTKRR